MPQFVSSSIGGDADGQKERCIQPAGPASECLALVPVLASNARAITADATEGSEKRHTAIENEGQYPTITVQMSEETSTNAQEFQPNEENIADEDSGHKITPTPFEACKAAGKNTDSEPYQEPQKQKLKSLPLFDFSRVDPLLFPATEHKPDQTVNDLKSDKADRGIERFKTRPTKDSSVPPARVSFENSNDDHDQTKSQPTDDSDIHIVTLSNVPEPAKAIKPSAILEAVPNVAPAQSPARAPQPMDEQKTTEKEAKQKRRDARRQRKAMKREKRREQKQKRMGSGPSQNDSTLPPDSGDNEARKMPPLTTIHKIADEQFQTARKALKRKSRENPMEAPILRMVSSAKPNPSRGINNDKAPVRLFDPTQKVNMEMAKQTNKSQSLEALRRESTVTKEEQDADRANRSSEPNTSLKGISAKSTEPREHVQKVSNPVRSQAQQTSDDGLCHLSQNKAQKRNSWFQSLASSHPPAQKRYKTAERSSQDKSSSSIVQLSGPDLTKEGVRQGFPSSICREDMNNYDQQATTLGSIHGTGPVFGQTQQNETRSEDVFQDVRVDKTEKTSRDTLSPFPLQILCSESFLEKDPNTIASLSTIQNERKVEVFDCPMVDQIGVDLELPGSIGICIHCLSELADGASFKAITKRVVGACARGCFEQLYVIVVYDIQPTTEASKHLVLSQMALLGFHTSTRVLFKSTTYTCTSIAEIFTSVECPANRLLVTLLSNNDALRKAKFLVTTLSRVSAYTALELVDALNHGEAWNHLFTNSRFRQQLVFENCNRDVMAQLAVLINTPFS